MFFCVIKGDKAATEAECAIWHINGYVILKTDERETHISVPGQYRDAVMNWYVGSPLAPAPFPPGTMLWYKHQADNDRPDKVDEWGIKHE